jgi:hypothetical protein
MYVIASNDLVGKYYWLSYFGSYDESTKTGTGTNYLTYGVSNYNQTSGILTYCIVIGNALRCDVSTISIVQKNNKLVPVLNLPQQGIRNAIINDIAFFQGGNQINQTVENATFDGLVLIDPNFQIAILMEQSIRDSVFTNMYFFNGEGSKDFNIPKLAHFELKYSNSEIKIFRVVF